MSQPQTFKIIPGEQYPIDFELLNNQGVVTLIQNIFLNTAGDCIAHGEYAEYEAVMKILSSFNVMVGKGDGIQL